MAKGSPWIGQLGLRLALAFVGVAFAAIASSILFGSVASTLAVDQLVKQQETDLTNATALAAGSAYGHSDWAHAELAPVIDFVVQAGAQVQVTDLAGNVMRQSPHFSGGGSGSYFWRQIIADHRPVGRVTVMFDGKGIGAAIARFEAERWTARIGATGMAAVIALLVALLVSRRITAPVDRLIEAARTRGRGDLRVRAGDVQGFGEIRELAEAFDEMADASEEQDRVRRNLVADVAHELRTPIAILQAGHEALIDGLAKPTSEHLTSLRDEVLRLARMVDDLQRLASAEAAALQLTLVPSDLAVAADGAADSLADAFAAAGITLQRRLAGAQVLCDPRRVHEIVTNLLTNAMKFTSAGGIVVMAAGPAEDDGAAMAVLRVSDSGIGIPSAELPMVSERFFRGQRSSGVAGSGIGLTIVSELVRAHHGSIEIRSEPGAGTEVTIRLPLVDADAPGRPTARASAPGERRVSAAAAAAAAAATASAASAVVAASDVSPSER
jgi:two-component system sensor histidine kinase BaeS